MAASRFSRLGGEVHFGALARVLVLSSFRKNRGFESDLLLAEILEKVVRLQKMIALIAKAKILIMIGCVDRILYDSDSTQK